MKITVETTVRAPLDTVWRAWSTPDDIVQWNAASHDWHTTAAAVDLRVGGSFSSRMEAKDGSMGFDFEGTYTEVEPMEGIAYALADGRRHDRPGQVTRRTTSCSSVATPNAAVVAFADRAQRIKAR